MTRDYLLPPDIKNLLAAITGAAPVHSVEDWDELVALADQHHMLPQLCEQVLGQATPIPERIVARCKQKVWELKLRAVTISHAVSSVQRHLDEHEIPAIWLKGVALAHSVYSSVWLRQMFDVDVLIPYDQRQRVYDIMVQAGHEPYAYTSSFLHHHVFLSSAKRRVPIELHYHLTPQLQLPLTDAATAWFFAQATAINTQVGTLHILKPEATLLHIAAHDILQHDFAELGAANNLEGIKLRRKYDVHLLVSEFDFDWQLVGTKAREFGWELALAEALAQARFLFGTPVPPEVLSALPDAATGADYVPFQLRKETMALRTLTQLSWRERLPYAWRLLFLPAALMRAKHGLGIDEPLWPFYMRRVVYTIGELVKLTVRRLRRQAHSSP